MSRPPAKHPRRHSTTRYRVDLLKAFDAMVREEIKITGNDTLKRSTLMERVLMKYARKNGYKLAD